MRHILIKKHLSWDPSFFNELNCLNLWMLFAHEESHNQSIMDLTRSLEIEQLESLCSLSWVGVVFSGHPNSTKKLFERISAVYTNPF